MNRWTALVATGMLAAVGVSSATANVVSFDLGRENIEGGGTQAPNALQGPDSAPATELWGDVAADDFSNADVVVVTHEGLTLTVGDDGGWSGPSRDRGGTAILQPVGSANPGTQADMFDVLRDFVQDNAGGLQMTLSGLAPNTTFDLRVWLFDATDSGPDSFSTMSIFDAAGGATAIATVSSDFADPDNSFTDFQSTSDANGEIVLAVSNDSGGGRLNGIEVLPEPASLSLLALGGLAMLRRRSA